MGSQLWKRRGVIKFWICLHEIVRDSVFLFLFYFTWWHRNKCNSSCIALPLFHFIGVKFWIVITLFFLIRKLLLTFSLILISYWMQLAFVWFKKWFALVRGEGRGFARSWLVVTIFCFKYFAWFQSWGVKICFFLAPFVNLVIDF